MIADSRFLNPGQKCYDDSGKSVLPMSFCISAEAAAFKRLFNSRGVSVKSVSKRKGKGKAIPLQAWTDPEVSRRLRLPDFKTTGT
jgi:hypothetical protein